MPKQRELILPKSVTLISEGPPRVLLSDGRRYTEQTEVSEGQQTLFVADGGGDSLSQETLRLMSEAERRREFRGGEETADPAVIARSEMAFLRSEIERLELQIETAGQRNMALLSERAVMVSQIADLRSENTRLSLLPERVELDALTKRAERAETNVDHLERLAGVYGVLPSDAVPQGEAFQPSQSAQSFEKRINAASGPVEVAQIVAEFEKALAAGRIKK
jgi:chorismate mutase